MVPSVTVNHLGPNHSHRHTAITTMFVCWYDGLFMRWCVCFRPVLLEHTPCISRIHRIHLPSNLWTFVRKCKASPCVLLSHQWISPWKSSSSLRCCSGFFYDLLDESLLYSWTNPSRWDGHSWEGSPLIMALIVVHRSSKARETSVTFS